MFIFYLLSPPIGLSFQKYFIGTCNSLHLITVISPLYLLTILSWKTCNIFFVHLCVISLYCRSFRTPLHFLFSLWTIFSLLLFSMFLFEVIPLLLLSFASWYKLYNTTFVFQGSLEQHLITYPSLSLNFAVTENVRADYLNINEPMSRLSVIPTPFHTPLCFHLLCHQLKHFLVVLLRRGLLFAF